MFLKLLIFFEHFYVAHYIFPIIYPVNKKIAQRALVLRAHYAMYRYMFTLEYQYNFRQITASFSAGRREQLVVGDMLLFSCSQFKYMLIKLDLVAGGKLYLVAQLIASMSTQRAWRLNHVCALKQKQAPFLSGKMLQTHHRCKAEAPRSQHSRIVYFKLK